MNATTGELWARVHEHLDAGRDPLADDDLVASLALEPDELAAVVRTCEQLRALAASAPAERASAAARLWPFAIPAAAAAIAMSWFVLRTSPTGATAPRIASPDRAAVATIADVMPRVLAWHAVTVEEGEDGRVERRLESGTSGPTTTSHQTTYAWTPLHRPDARRPGVLSFVANLREP